MKYDEFMKFIRTQPVNDYIVRLQYKYDHEDNYTITNEYLYADIHRSGINYIWLDDWNEGYDYIYVLGFIALSEVSVSKLDFLNSAYKEGQREVIAVISNITNDILIKKDTNGYRPIKNTSKEDCYRALYDIIELLRNLSEV